ncbi:hypothetical protein EIKCOROL_00470 [Eikenella corrodens ATCC 23834]|uniref:Uncharacterized protein n=1 Tax=Eikenella corrodens ATCC 23834 TaxID=546274 RepID=C0DSZ6_EIKCO|nr:hypothetical protein EIKCOROL_00470 [Eikenella corrodens ATCC 23834]
MAGVSVAKRRNCKASKGFQVACGAVGLTETIAGEQVKFCSVPCGRRGREFYNCTLSASMNTGYLKPGSRRIPA